MNTIKNNISKFWLQYVVGIITVVIIAIMFYNNIKNDMSYVVSDTQATTTASSTIPVVATSSPVVPRPTSTTYTNKLDGYQIVFPVGFTLREGVSHGALTGLRTEASIVTYPESYRSATTLLSTDILISVSSTTCSTWIDGQNKLHTAKTETRNGITFEVRNSVQMATGNFWYDKEFSTTRNNMCYRIMYHEYGTNPAVTYSEKTQIDAITAKNEAARKTMLQVFDRIITTFKFI